jgi:hypothetical protein
MKGKGKGCANVADGAFAHMATIHEESMIFVSF